MYTCSECDFESEDNVSPTGQHTFIKGLCRTCYFRQWRNLQPESTFNTTCAEESHYIEVGYNLGKVQRYLCGRM